MVEEVRRSLRIGSAEGLQFELALNETTPKGLTGLAWGQGLLRFGGEAVWCGEDTPDGEAPLSWTWLDLLEFLARNWPWLVLEETYPIPVNPLFPGSLRREAEQRWEKDDLPDEVIDREDEEVYRFLCRHDLAMALKGLFVPALILMRQGQQFMLSCPALRLEALQPAEEIIATLAQLGDHLSTVVADSTDPRAILARDLWEGRQERLRQSVVPLRTGLDAASLEHLTLGTAANDDYWEIDADSPEADTVMLAAARMTAGHIDIDAQRDLLQRIRNFPPTAHPALDALCTRLVNEFNETGRPFEQGYRLAEWLRRALSLEPDAPADPDGLLHGWGVTVEVIDLPNCALEAIAAWGPRHGPVILHRPVTDQPMEQDRPYTRTRLRSTLAHEICHLLIDRERGLPVADVLGGRSPEYPEKRARAFAAEFLLPREAAAAEVRTAQTLNDALRGLQERFEVSRELAAWQITNSSAFSSLNAAEQSQIQAICRSAT